MNGCLDVHSVPLTSEFAQGNCVAFIEARSRTTRLSRSPLWTYPPQRFDIETWRIRQKGVCFLLCPFAATKRTPSKATYPLPIWSCIWCSTPCDVFVCICVSVCLKGFYTPGNVFCIPRSRTAHGVPTLDRLLGREPAIFSRFSLCNAGVLEALFLQRETKEPPCCWVQISKF